MYSRKKEQNGVTAAWSHAALEDFMLQSVLLYLAVAHFGRGRGNWTESEYPPAWKETVEKVLKNHQAEDKHLPIMVQPVLEELGPEYEEAAETLGATRWQSFRHPCSSCDLCSPLMSEGPFPSGSCPLHGTNRRTIAGSNNLEKLYLAGEFGGNYPVRQTQNPRRAPHPTGIRSQGGETL